MTDEIYTTLPERPVTDEKLRNNILEYLKKHSEEWHKVNTIARAVGFEEKDSTKPTIRQACRELLHFFKEPVVSSHAGFTYTFQESVLRRFKDNIESRIKGMRRTVSDIDIVLSGGCLEGGFRGVVSSDVGCGGVPGLEHRFVPYKDGGFVCIVCGQLKPV